MLDDDVSSVGSVQRLEDRLEQGHIDGL